MKNYVAISCLMAKLAGMILGSIENLFFAAVESMNGYRPLFDEEDESEQPTEEEKIMSTPEPSPQEVIKETTVSAAQQIVLPEEKHVEQTTSQSSEKPLQQVTVSNGQLTIVEEESIGTKISSVPRSYDAFCDQVLPTKRVPTEE